MAIGTVLKINNVEPAKLSGYSVSRGKLWDDAGRNLAGELKATLIGIFPKISLKFVPTTQEEMNEIIGLLEPSVLIVQWWDEKSQSVKVANFYAGDYDIGILNKSKDLYSGFNVNLIAYSKYV